MLWKCEHCRFLGCIYDAKNLKTGNMRGFVPTLLEHRLRAPSLRFLRNFGIIPRH